MVKGYNKGAELVPTHLPKEEELIVVNWVRKKKIKSAHYKHAVSYFFVCVSFEGD